MGIFTHEALGTTLPTDIIECNEFSMDEVYRIVNESEENYGKIMQAVGLSELAYYEQTGEEMVYTEAAGAGFFANMKNFFINVWKKIQGLFKKFIAMFDSFAMDDKAFWKKYGVTVMKHGTDLSDFKIKGYKYTTDKIDVEKMNNNMGTKYGYLKDSLADAESAIKLLDAEPGFDTKNYDSTDFNDKLRGIALGKSGTGFTQKEFTDELFEMYRDGDNSPSVLDDKDIDLTTMVQQPLLNSKDSKKKADNNLKTFKRVIDANVKLMDSFTKKTATESTNASTSTDTIHKASIITSRLRAALSILQVGNGVHLAAIKAESRQAKAIAVKLVNYKPKGADRSYGESADMYTGSIGSIPTVSLI